MAEFAPQKLTHKTLSRAIYRNPPLHIREGLIVRYLGKGGEAKVTKEVQKLTDDVEISAVVQRWRGRSGVQEVEVQAEEDGTVGVAIGALALVNVEGLRPFVLFKVAPYVTLTVPHIKHLSTLPEEAFGAISSLFIDEEDDNDVGLFGVFDEGEVVEELAAEDHFTSFITRCIPLPNLQTFNLSNANISTLPHFATLPSLTPHLRHLNLCNCQLVGEVGREFFGVLWGGGWAGMEEVSLRRVVVDSGELGRIFDRDVGWDGLRKLCLFDCKVKDGFGKGIGSGLRCKKLLGLEELEFYMSLEAEDIREVVDALKESPCPRLKALHFTSIPLEHVEEVFGDAVRGMGTLRKVCCSGCCLHTITPFLQPPRTLITLSVPNNPLGPPAATTIASALRTSPAHWKQLRELNLNDVKLGEDGAVELFEAMEDGEVMVALEGLYVDDNYIGEKGGMGLAKMLGRKAGWKALRNFSAEDNDMGNASTAAVLDAYQPPLFPNLTQFSLRNNASGMDVQRARERMEERLDGRKVWVRCDDERILY